MMSTCSPICSIAWPQALQFSPASLFLGFSGVELSVRDSSLSTMFCCSQLLTLGPGGVRVVSAYAEGGLNGMPLLEPNFISLGAYNQGELEGPPEGKPGDLSLDFTELKQWTQR